MCIFYCFVRFILFVFLFHAFSSSDIYSAIDTKVNTKENELYILQYVTNYLLTQNNLDLIAIKHAVTTRERCSNIGSVMQSRRELNL